uniref:N-chimaerin-like isoform X2 n=1 Tax=Myxine glutinosa TaxID=7769 RepID=UPI00358EF283
MNFHDSCHGKPSEETLAASLGVTTGRNPRGNLWKNFRVRVCTRLSPGIPRAEVHGVECVRSPCSGVRRFKVSKTCSHCHYTIWGFVSPAYKCLDCGLHIHKQCVGSLEGNCTTHIAVQQITPFLSPTIRPLIELAQRPPILDLCIVEIESRGHINTCHGGIKSEGLYRLCGASSLVEEVYGNLNKDGAKADVSAETYNDVNIIAGALKLYLRDLPSPVVTYEAYPQLIAAARLADEQSQLKAVCHFLKELPFAHLDTLHCLMAHLGRVAQHEADNRMGPENLARVFGPTLLRPPNDDPILAIQDIHLQKKLTELFIRHHHLLF